MTLRSAYPYYVGGQAEQPNESLTVLDKYTGEIASRVARADRTDVIRAIASAVSAVEDMRTLPAHARRAALLHVASRVRERAGELAEVVCIEAGKPIRDARTEVARLLDTFTLASEEATRIEGNVIPFDGSPRSTGCIGFSRRVPVGACAFITPFNFPLNLVAHKVAPAIAAGCPFVLKPSPYTPISAVLLAEILAETELPAGAFSVVPCDVEDAQLLVTDDRLRLLSFTGSARVGWALKAQAGKKQVVLELGGNAAVVVDETADVDHAVARIAFGAFYQSGQSCISVQRVLVHASIYDDVREKLVTAAGGLRVGPPRDEATFLGPVISESEAARICGWVEDAVKRGARVLCGGTRAGAVVHATLVEDVPHDCLLSSEEVFGPVAVLERFTDFGAALARVNDSRYGLQAGIFATDLRRALQAWNDLNVGGVIVGDVPSWRADSMPYGGTKDSGLGREGVRSAIEHMTEVRMLVLAGDTQPPRKP